MFHLTHYNIMENKYTRLKWLALIIIAGILLFLAQSAFAVNKPLISTSFPQQQITGKVTDQVGLPLIGVTVMVKGSNTGTITNLEGIFQLPIPQNSTLVFSFIGYKTLEVPFTGEKEINVTLAEDITSLGEVEINAGYYNTTRRESTGNISRITAEEIELQPVLNPLAAIQGRMPGVQITQTSGTPGSGFDIKIRGRNSLRALGNEPLYIIDGVPYASNTLGYNQVSGNILPGSGTSPLNVISTNDIASIEVLKDADATAIYGSRGANGVVLITTKKGKTGKTNFNINANSGIGQITQKFDLLSTQEYLNIRKEAFENDGIVDYPGNAYDINGTWDQNRYTDWQEKLLGNNANITSIDLRIDGGNAYTNFRVSGNYRLQTTVFPGDFKYEKAGANANFGNQSEDGRFSINVTGNYSVENNDQPGSDLLREAIKLPPNAPELYTEDGELNWENSTWQNPLRIQNASFKSVTNNFLANAVIDYKLLPDFNFKVNLGYTNIQHTESRTSSYTIYDPAYQLDSEFSGIYLNNSTRRSWIVEPQLNLQKEFDKNKLNFLVGATFQNQKDVRLYQEGRGFSNEQLIYDLSAANSVFTLNNDKITYKYQAFFGRLNYKYDNRYIINLTGRRDGSSRFGTANRFAWFGAIGTAWIFSEEPFFTGNDLLSFGKIRGSYGITGNDQIGDYQYLDTYSTTGNIYNGTAGLSPSRLFNPDFGWETNKKFEVGLEIGFLDNNLFFSGSYFRNLSSNQLVGIPLPGTTGFPSIQANLNASVENTGVELFLETKNINNENFSWNSSFNLSILNNKLLRFPDLEGSTYENQFVLGQSLNIQKLYQYEGLDLQTGLFTFTDFDGDGRISSPNDRQSIQDLSPSFFGGLTNSLSYSNFKLDFLFQFVKQENYNEISLLGLPGDRNNHSREVLDRWQSPGDQSTYQYLTAGYNSDALNKYVQYFGSDAIITDASYIRLKNISLSYSVPKKWLKLVNARLYMQGQNLLTFTNYRGADPEFTTTGYLPPLKIYTAGVDITF